MKYLKIILLIIIISADLKAAGIFNLGIMAGAANDSGNAEKIAGDINTEMSSSGTTGTDIETIYSPVVSVNMAYFNNALMLKVGWEYNTNIFYNPPGSFGSPENKIEIDYARYTFPVSIGLVIPLTDRNRFYFAGGFNMSYLMLKVKQSNPGTLSLYPDASHTFSTFVAGTHLKFGAETLLKRNYSFSVEFTQYFGNPRKIISEDKNSEVFMGVNSFEVTAGINYNLNL